MSAAASVHTEEKFTWGVSAKRRRRRSTWRAISAVATWRPITSRHRSRSSGVTRADTEAQATTVIAAASTTSTTARTLAESDQIDQLLTPRPHGGVLSRWLDSY